MTTEIRQTLPGVAYHSEDTYALDKERVFYRNWFYVGRAERVARPGAWMRVEVADETTDIGYESGTTVSTEYTAGTSRFSGKVHWVQLDVGKDDHDHFIDPEERLRIAMARQ